MLNYVIEPKDSPPQSQRYCLLRVKYDIVVNCKMLTVLPEGNLFLCPICRHPLVHIVGFEATGSTASPASSRSQLYVAVICAERVITMTLHGNVCV